MLPGIFVPGMAVALLLVPAAHAEDAVTPYEWEEQEHVGACDHLGSGYMKLPGTNTCARVSGQIRYERRFLGSSNRSDGQVIMDFETRSD